MRCQPLLDRLAVMHTEVIEHQEDLPSGLLDKRLEELDQSHMVEVAVDDHPACLALVGNGRNHRQLLTCTANDVGYRRIPLGCVATATHVGIDHRCLIT